MSPGRAVRARRRSGRLWMRLATDPDVLALPAAAPRGEPTVSEADLAGLPEAARQYLSWAGVEGRAADWSFRLHSRGRFRLRRDWPWLACEAWQYNSRPAVARVFHLRLDLAGLAPLLGRDSYLRGRGAMAGRLLGRLPVVRGSGSEYDVSELVTFLNDAVLLAPSMLLRLPVTWAGAGKHAFDVTLADAGHRVTARVCLDERGAPRDFSTEDRYCDTPSGPVRARWCTPVRGWRETDGRWLPSSGSATWHLPDGPLTYARFRWEPGDIRWNVPPPRLARPAGRSRPRPVRRQASDLRNWGATGQERRLALPGDELIPEPAEMTTIGVTVAAPTAEVWRWLVQIGQDRGGLYS